MPTSNPKEEGRHVTGLWVEPSPLPDTIPSVQEVGCTSAPLESMSYFFGSFCKPYSDDYILCKNENADPSACLKEGRKVTRCAIDLIQKLKENCNESWKAHYECYDLNNHMFEKCRSQETKFNQCVFEKLGLTKSIPGTPEGQVPVHEKPNPIYK